MGNYRLVSGNLKIKVYLIGSLISVEIRKPEKIMNKIVFWLFGVLPRILFRELKIKVDPRCPNRQPILPPAKPGDVGMDMVCWVDDINCKISVPPHKMVNVPIGASIKLPPNTWGSIRSRSSTFAKRELFVMDGTIDEAYVGPLFIYVWNPGSKAHEISNGERLAQLIIMPRIVPKLKYVDELPVTERAETGFGSTGY